MTFHILIFVTLNKNSDNVNTYIRNRKTMNLYLDFKTTKSVCQITRHTHKYTESNNKTC